MSNSVSAPETIFEIVEQWQNFHTTVTQKYVLYYPERPWTTNAERTWHHMKRHSTVKVWREAFAWLAKAEKVPSLRWMTVHAIPLLTKRGRLQDVGGCNPAVKAAIDGLVDAGVVPDDSPKFLHSVTFHAPVIMATPGLALLVCGEPSESRPVVTR